MVEHRTDNPAGGGSNPSPRTMTAGALVQELNALRRKPHPKPTHLIRMDDLVAEMRERGVHDRRP